jgi:hypothetical protein
VYDNPNNGFSPDPVNIVTGESVNWTDDGTGFTIFIDALSWSAQIPCGATFPDTGTYPYYDDNGNTGTINVSANLPPTVTITSPTNQMTFTSSAIISFSVDAADPGADGLYGVELFLGQTLIGQFTSEPFTASITNLPSGTYILTAIAFNNSTATTTNQMSITIVGSGSPQSIAVTAPRLIADSFQFDVSGLTVGKTNMIETITDPSAPNWVTVVTNVAAASTMTFTNSATNSTAFFRVVQLP